MTQEADKMLTCITSTSNVGLHLFFFFFFFLQSHDARKRSHDASAHGAHRASQDSSSARLGRLRTSRGAGGLCGRARGRGGGGRGTQDGLINQALDLLVELVVVSLDVAGQGRVPGRGGGKRLDGRELRDLGRDGKRGCGDERGEAGAGRRGAAHGGAVARQRRKARRDFGEDGRFVGLDLWGGGDDCSVYAVWGIEAKLQRGADRHTFVSTSRLVGRGVVMIANSATAVVAAVAMRARARFLECILYVCMYVCVSFLYSLFAGFLVRVCVCVREREVQ